MLVASRLQVTTPEEDVNMMEDCKTKVTLAVQEVRDSLVGELDRIKSALFISTHVPFDMLISAIAHPVTEVVLYTFMMAIRHHLGAPTCARDLNNFSSGKGNVKSSSEQAKRPSRGIKRS